MVLAGGNSAGNQVQMLDVTTMTWQRGPNLPTNIEHATAVPFGRSFLVTGGWLTSSILQFDPDQLDWIIRNETLPETRGFHYAALFENGELSCD